MTSCRGTTQTVTTQSQHSKFSHSSSAHKAGNNSLQNRPCHTPAEKCARAQRRSSCMPARRPAGRRAWPLRAHATKVSNTRCSAGAGWPTSQAAKSAQAPVSPPRPARAASSTARCCCAGLSPAGSAAALAAPAAAPLSRRPPRAHAARRAARSGRGARSRRAAFGALAIGAHRATPAAYDRRSGTPRLLQRRREPSMRGLRPHRAGRAGGRARRPRARA